LHHNWLKTLAESGDAICISKAVADELAEWHKKNGTVHRRPFTIEWFHLGADINASMPSKGMPDEAQALLSAISASPSFLMVGTLEPRKGYAQILAAFEKLWEQDLEVNLIIVGKQGWKMKSLRDRLRHHARLGKTLFWLDGISDEYLEKIYAASTCLIAASEGEGFGLPLIEAAQHKLPIIARDIPVFREVAGNHAFYFKGQTAESIKEALISWLNLNSQGQAPSVENMEWLTWKDSMRQLMSKILPAS